MKMTENISFFEKDNYNNRVNVIDLKFINLSSYLLATAEQSFLLKGLKCCPTSEKFDYVQEKADMYNICRKIRIKEFFCPYVDRRVLSKSHD